MATVQWWRSLSFAVNRNGRPACPRSLAPVRSHRTVSTKGEKPLWEARGSRGSDQRSKRRGPRSERLPSKQFKKSITEERSSDGFNQSPDRRGPQYDYREKCSPDSLKNSIPEERGSGGLRHYGEPLAERNSQPKRWPISKFRKAATSLDDEDSWEEISGDVRLLHKHYKDRKEALEKRTEQVSKHVAVDGDGKSHPPDVGSNGQSEPAKHSSTSSNAISEKHDKSAEGNDRAASNKVHQQDHGKPNRPHSAGRSENTISEDSNEVDEDLLAMISVLPEQDRERILALFNKRHQQDRDQPDRTLPVERSEMATSEDSSNIASRSTATQNIQSISNGKRDRPLPAERFRNAISEDSSKAANGKIGTGDIQFTSNAEPRAGKPFPSVCLTPRDPSEVDDLNAAMKDIPSPSSERHPQFHDESDQPFPSLRVYRFGDATSEEPGEAANGTSSMEDISRAPRGSRQQDHGRSDQSRPAARVYQFGKASSEDSGNAVDGKTSVFDTPSISSKAQQHGYGEPERPITVKRVSDLVAATTAELRKAGDGKASMGQTPRGLGKNCQQDHSKSKQPRPAEPLSDSEKTEPRPWTEDEVDLLHEMRHQDVKNKKIAERLGRTPEDTMRKWFDAKKDMSEEVMLTAEEMELVSAQRNTGSTWASIKKTHFPNIGVKTLRKAAVRAAGNRGLPRWPDQGSERRRLELEHPVRMTPEEAVEIRERREQKIGWSTIMRDFLGQGTDVPEFVFRRAYNKRIAAYDKAQRKERKKEQKEARKERVKQKLEVRRARKAEMRAEQKRALAAKHAKQAAKSTEVANGFTSSWSPFPE